MIWLWGKIKVWLAFAGIVIAAIGVAWMNGRKAGAEHIESEQAKKRDALQQHYDEIDGRGLSPDDAYKRLRERSSDRNMP